MKNWTRQHWLVAGLVLLMAYLLWSRLIAPGLATEQAVGTSSVRRNAWAPEQIVALRADLLEVDAGVYKKGRNVFAYQSPKPKPKPKAVRRPAPKPAPEQSKKQEVVPKGPQRPQLPTLNMTYLGSFGPRRRPIAVFRDGEDLYNVRVGDVVKGEFVLVQVGFESADLGYVNFPTEEPKRLEITGS